MLKGPRLVDLAIWICIGSLLMLFVLSIIGCESWGVRVDRTLDVIEKTQEAGAEIREDIATDDWFGLTESLLVGAAAVASALGGKKVYDKVKKNGAKES